MSGGEGITTATSRCDTFKGTSIGSVSVNNRVFAEEAPWSTQEDPRGTTHARGFCSWSRRTKRGNSVSTVGEAHPKSEDRARSFS